MDIDGRPSHRNRDSQIKEDEEMARALQNELNGSQVDELDFGGETSSNPKGLGSASDLKDYGERLLAAKCSKCKTENRVDGAVAVSRTVCAFKDKGMCKLIQFPGIG
jgi:hypothetical protein